jgi:hypothetical protein
VVRVRGRRLPNSARRHFLAASKAMASRVTALALLSSAAWALPANSRPTRGPNCFLKGTCILTAEGEAAIEDLRVGTLVMTMSGELQPIKWLGRNTYRKSGPGWSERVIPIRISCFAIDGLTPNTDLYLSPNHALYLDGSLIPVKQLENGISILPVMPQGLETVEYFQIVLETHEVVWAAGVPAETFAASNRAAFELFDNFHEYEQLYPADSFAIGQMAPELHMGGRAHLSALVGLGLSMARTPRNPIEEIYRKIAARAVERDLAA